MNATATRYTVQVAELPGETELVTENRGRWLYVSVRKWNARGLLADVDQRYLHVDCDVLTDNDGNCAACGAPSPTSLDW